MDEELFLWAEEEDRKRWMESIIIMQGDNTSCYEKITQLGSLSCAPRCPTEQEVSSASVAVCWSAGLSWRVMQMLLADQSFSTTSPRVGLRWRDWRR
jgi:hypothetical protein